MKEQKTNTGQSSPSWTVKAKVIIIGGLLTLIKTIREDLIYLRSGRKPILVMKMPRESSQHEYITAIQSVIEDRKINRDYHVFILQGKTNADFTHEVFAGKYKKLEIENLKKEIMASILKQKVFDDQKKADFEKLKHGDKHHSKGIKPVWRRPDDDTQAPLRN